MYETQQWDTGITFSNEKKWKRLQNENHRQNIVKQC